MWVWKKLDTHVLKFLFTKLMKLLLSYKDSLHCHSCSICNNSVWEHPVIPQYQLWPLHQSHLMKQQFMCTSLPSSPLDRLFCAGACACAPVVYSNWQVTTQVNRVCVSVYISMNMCLFIGQLQWISNITNYITVSIDLIILLINANNIVAYSFKGPLLHVLVSDR